MMKLKPRKLKETPSQQLTNILRRMLEKNLITQEQFEKLNIPLKKKITQEVLLSAMVKAGVINPVEPFDESVNDFMEELGSLPASDLVGFSESLRLDKKGLNNMTPIPVKAFPIPANVLFFALIGLAMFIVIVAPNWTAITNGVHLGQSGPGSLGGLFGGLMPHFIFGVKSLVGLI